MLCFPLESSIPLFSVQWFGSGVFSLTTVGGWEKGVNTQSPASLQTHPFMWDTRVEFNDTLLIDLLTLPYKLSFPCFLLAVLRFYKLSLEDLVTAMVTLGC